MLQDKINYSIALLRKCEKMALDYDPENGFYLAFSGGKDLSHRKDGWCKV